MPNMDYPGPCTNCVGDKECVIEHDLNNDLITLDDKEKKDD